MLVSTRHQLVLYLGWKWMDDAGGKRLSRHIGFQFSLKLPLTLLLWNLVTLSQALPKHLRGAGRKKKKLYTKGKKNSTLRGLWMPFTMEKKCGPSDCVHNKWGRGNLVPGGAQIQLCPVLFRKASRGWKCVHTALSFSLTLSRTHTVSLPGVAEREIPDFRGWLTCRRTVSEWNSSVQPTSNAILSGQRCMLGPRHLCRIGFIHLFTGLPCRLSERSNASGYTEPRMGCAACELFD